MKHIRRTGWVAVAIALAVAGSQVPRRVRAGEHAPVVVMPTTKPTGGGWELKNPDATYAISADMCTGLSASSLATQAVSNDPEQVKSAIDQLRDAGPAGLDALLEANKAEVAKHRGGGLALAFDKPNSNWPKIRSAIDAVAAQRDAYASGLYWYTDFAKAQAASRASGKPILSLRLLGNLSDEYSCANSRFFRTVLYANADVSKELREKFILHWQSVRPVPVITIDFGDGRKIRRTITGNSIHYVLTAEGQVVDGIPGLYGPKAFLRELGEAEKVCGQITSGTNQSKFLERWHADQIVRINEAFKTDCVKLSSAATYTLESKVQIADPSQVQPRDKVRVEIPGPGVSFVGVPIPAPPTEEERAAMAHAGVTVSPPIKVQIVNVATAPSDAITKRTLPDTNLPEARSPSDLADFEWVRLAALHSEDSQLDRGSQTLIAAKSPDAATAARRAMSKMYVETPLIRTMRNFQRSIAEDTVRTEYLFHLQIHRWLADPASANLANDVGLLNRKIYAELFLTPDSDPWLGLVPADTYSALDDDGVCH